jgi:hypothetical protein
MLLGDGWWPPKHVGIKKLYVSLSLYIYIYTVCANVFLFKKKEAWNLSLGIRFVRIQQGTVIILRSDLRQNETENTK